MRLKVSDPELLLDLLEFFESRRDAVTAKLSLDEIEVSLLGSYNTDAMQLQLYLLIRAWEAGRKSQRNTVEIIS